MKQSEGETLLFNLHLGLELLVAIVHGVPHGLEHVFNLFFRVLVVGTGAVGEDVEFVNNGVHARGCNAQNFSFLVSFSGMVLLVFMIVSPFHFVEVFFPLSDYIILHPQPNVNNFFYFLLSCILMLTIS